jgi:ribosomal protein S12 methylthiotransferase
MDEQEVICPYLDLPLQHINEEILRAMGRPFIRENAWQLLERIRSIARRISLRTTLMVGFPGETEEKFEELYRFVEAAGFDHLGAFVFSPEKGTPAARFRGHVAPEVAERRLDALMGLQAEISKKHNGRMLGRIVPVLIEGVSPETDLLLSGRTATMAPEVDGRILINKGQAEAGEIVPVLMKEAHTYDLVGEIVE